MKLRVLVLCLGLLTMMVLFARATGTIQLPQTGQTTSYAAGDDGALQTGVPSPTPRFTNNSNGTVTDNLTGLIWLKNANCFSTQTWANALTSANTLASGACGLTDGSTAGQWRLPNVDELESLVDLSQYNPVLPVGHPFSTVQADYYWSSSTFVGGTGGASKVYMFDGYIDIDNKASSMYVWPVRGGGFAALPAPTISGTPSAATTGISYSFTPITANATSFSITGTLPPGLSFNTSSGAITGTPTTAGTYSGIQITATGAGGSTNLSGLSITVNMGTPSITSWPTATGITLGQALSSSTLTGGSASVPGTFAFTNSATVPGSTGSYSASVTFTPTGSANYNNVPGSVNVEVSSPAPTISGTPSVATVGTSYTFTPTTANATSFSLSAGTLPPGLSFSTSTGAITGTPTTAGTYSGIQITASGSGGSTNLTGLSITANKGTPYIISWPTASGITLGQALSSSTLTGGSASVPGTFAFTNSATVPGSTGSYTASVTFTPTSSTNYNNVTGNVTVALTSSGGGSGSVSGDVTVEVSTPVPVMEGWWLLPGVLAGLGMFTRRRKE